MVSLQSVYSPYASLHLFVLVSIFISVCVSPCRLSVQAVSHEPLLGPEAVLESSEAWREHGHSAPQQAPCKQSDNVFTSLQSLQTSTIHTDLSSQAHRKKEEKRLSYITLMVDLAEINAKLHREYILCIEILHSKILCILSEVELLL